MFTIAFDFESLANFQRVFQQPDLKTHQIVFNMNKLWSRSVSATARNTPSVGSPPSNGSGGLHFLVEEIARSIVEFDVPHTAVGTPFGIVVTEEVELSRVELRCVIEAALFEPVREWRPGCKGRGPGA